jgi:hydroxylamine reductase
MSMFCFQCQETSKNQGCTIRGVCGKEPEVAALQDLLIWLLKGLSFYAVRARQKGISDPEADEFAAKALFTTITNANFDPERFVALAKQAVALRDGLKAKLGANAPQPTLDAATWSPKKWEVGELAAKGATVGVMADPGLNEDPRSLRELLTYGLKGLAAYAHHAYMLDHHNDALLHFIQEGLLFTTNGQASVDDLVGMVLKCGQMGVQTMALLDEANTASFGHPEPTQVNIGVRPGPAILVSGHDLRDLDELLQQTEGKGVNVYTHGEMLPANAYPGLKKYPHLVGNYGGSWWHQQEEFEKFGGAILLTTNCLIKPRDSYKGRLFTTGATGWPGIPHIADRTPGKQKDFAAVIAKALASGSPQPVEEGTIPIGFAHNAVLSMADKVIAAVKAGAVCVHGWLRRTAQGAPVLHRSRQGPATGHGHPHGGLRQVPLQQAEPGHHRRHPARARCGPMQRLVLAGCGGTQAGRSVRSRAPQRAAHLLRHRLVRAKSGHRAPGIAQSGREEHPPRPDVARVCVSQRAEGAGGQVRPQADDDG